MLFRSRMQGELVLTKGPMRSRRPIQKGEELSFSGKTLEHYGEDIKYKVRRGMLAPLDDEARVFVGSSTEDSE